MPAARSVRADPAVETSCASHSNVKSRRRKTANIDGAGATAAVMGSPVLSPGIARSLPVRRRDCNALAQQQRALQVEALLARPPAVAAVPADRAVRRDDPMARDEQADRVPPHRAADGPRSPWRPDGPGDVAIARRPAPRDLG